MLTETRLLSVEMRQQSSLNDDELEFYVDMAINETQRWLEASTRERFLDDDDFIFSLKNGFQLRKIVNRLIPGSFHIEDDIERLDKTKKQNLPDGFSKPWIETFLCLCVSKLGIPERNLFHISDFEEHFYNSIRCSDGTCQENQSRICRVVVTVYELALLCEASRCYTGPRIDRTAVEPLVAYYIANNYINSMDSKKNKKLEQDSDSVANNHATTEITESEESGYDSSVKGLMNHNKVPLAPKSLPTTVNQLVHEKVTKYLTEQVMTAEGNEDQMSECQFSDTLRSLSPDDFSPPPSSAGTSYCTSRGHGYNGMVRKNPYQFLSSSPPFCSLKEERELWKMNKMKMEKYNEQKSKRTKIDLKWVDQFNIWKEKRRAKFESSHATENATNSTTVAEIESHQQFQLFSSSLFIREKLQPSGILARHSEVSPLMNKSGEWTTTMATELPKKEFTAMIMQNKYLGHAMPTTTTTTLQENKQLANSFDRKLSLEDSGHFGGESDDTDERLSASPGTLDSPSSNVANIINGKHDMRSLTMGNCYGKLASATANNGIEVNSKQSPVNVTKLTFALNDGLQKPENGIRHDNADGSELTYACNLVRFQKERNFGFTLKGGLNSGEPLRIDQVTPGLSADRAGVKAGDILVSVNSALVRDDLIGKANMMIKEAVFVSHVELVLEKSEKEPSETNSGISTPRKLSSTSKDFTATGQSNSTNWFLQRRAMFEKLSAAESDAHPAKADFRIEPKTEVIEDMKETSAPKVPYVNTNFGNSVTNRPNVGYRVVSMYEPRQPGRISDFIPEYERKEETSNNYANTYNAMNECVTGSYRRTPSDCCPTLIRNYDLGNCNTNLAVGMGLPSYRGEISSIDFEAEPDDASLSKPKHNCTTLKTSINKIGNSSNSNNRNVTNSWRAVDNSNNMEFKYWNMAANAAEPDAAVLACNKNNSATMNGNFCSNTENAASSMRRQAYNHWLVQEAEHQRLSDQLISERTAKNHADERKKKMPTPQAVSASHLCSHCNMELGHGAAMSIESLKLFYHLSCFKCYVCGVKLGDGAVGADVRVRCGKLHCQSCYSNDEAGYRLSEV
ncbi:LIM and calponin homology domains-containing protein 1 [Trichinella pseudospiralis]|uniref:LIM and calponin homology domains-containing protein 1 n=1 Tax=Trichinella pseudospiralis TaxID=6337 RepID=A0A0V1K5U9_TRIPS|nr:LIM and calponin homology domains-containing protein 1 [Trichinella pseudospiralis]